MRCAMTDREYPDFSDGVWDDGEWISWDWINQQVYEQDLRKKYSQAEPELIEVFERFVELAADYKLLTGHYLQVWGELGELYAQIKFGIKRHRPKSQGSDGKIGNDFVEIKTISPEKSKHEIAVKRAGHFSKLVVVKVSEDFEFEARIIDRHALRKGTGKVASVPWQQMPKPSK